MRPCRLDYMHTNIGLRGVRKTARINGRPCAVPWRPMNSPSDYQVAARFAKACVEARAHLWRQMEERGFYERDGWKIVETVRQIKGGSELVMRPLHLRKIAPDDLECVITIDEESTAVDSNCTP